MSCIHIVIVFVDFFKKFPCVFSLTDSNRKAKEEAAYIFFMDFWKNVKVLVNLTYMYKAVFFFGVRLGQRISYCGIY